MKIPLATASSPDAFQPDEGGPTFYLRSLTAQEKAELSSAVEAGRLDNAAALCYAADRGLVRHEGFDLQGHALLECLELVELVVIGARVLELSELAEVDMGNLRSRLQSASSTDSSAAVAESIAPEAGPDSTPGNIPTVPPVTYARIG